MNKIKELFFEDLAKSLEYWADEGAKSLTDESTDLMWTENPEAFERVRELLAEKAQVKDVELILSEMLRGFAVSFLTIIDGGTELSETSQIGLFDHEQKHLGELHDDFVSHLINTDRL